MNISNTRRMNISETRLMNGSCIKAGRILLGLNQRAFRKCLKDQYGEWFSPSLLSRVENSYNVGEGGKLLARYASEFLRSQGIDDDVAGNMIFIKPPSAMPRWGDDRVAAMGAWGPGAFENDNACDFAAAVADGGGVSALTEALDRVLSSEGEYLEAPDAEEGLAAAEIVARLRGSAGEETAYTAAVDAWVKNLRAAVSDDLAEKARRSTARILVEPSELLELWAESDDFDGWKRGVEELLKRL